MKHNTLLLVGCTIFSCASLLFTSSRAAADGTVVLQENLGAKLISNPNLGPVRVVEGGRLYLPAGMTLNGDQSIVSGDLRFRVECPLDYEVARATAAVYSNTNIPVGGKRLYSSVTASASLESKITIIDKCKEVLTRGVTNEYSHTMTLKTHTNCQEDQSIKSYDHETPISMKVICEDLTGIMPPHKSSIVTPAVEYSCPTVPKSLNSAYYENYRFVVKGTPYSQVATSADLPDPQCVRVNSNNSSAQTGRVITGLD